MFFDSAGVRVSRTDSISMASLVYAEASEAPILRIGDNEADGATVLFQVKGALVVGDTAVAVLDGSSAEVRVFDLTGRLTQTWAGRGDGPGELRLPTSMSSNDDGHLEIRPTHCPHY